MHWKMEQERIKTIQCLVGKRERETSQKSKEIQSWRTKKILRKEQKSLR